MQADCLARYYQECKFYKYTPVIFVLNQQRKEISKTRVHSTEQLYSTQVITLFSNKQQRRVSHFHFYENLVAANLGMRFALWQLREIASKELFCYD